MATILIVQNDSGISRLYTFLSHVKHFPSPLQFAAITAGISEQEVRYALERTPFAVVGDQIMPRSELDRFGQMSVSEADYLYRSRGVIVLCRDGRPVCQSLEEYEQVGIKEESHPTGGHERCRKGYYQSIGLPHLDGADAPPITAEAVMRFFGETSQHVQRRLGSGGHGTDS